jgi:hypothetical protein
MRRVASPWSCRRRLCLLRVSSCPVCRTTERFFNVAVRGPCGKRCISNWTNRGASHTLSLLICCYARCFISGTYGLHALEPLTAGSELRSCNVVAKPDQAAPSARYYFTCPRAELFKPHWSSYRCAVLLTTTVPCSHQACRFFAP